MEISREDLIRMGAIKPDQEIEEVEVWPMICALFGFIVMVGLLGAYLIIGDDFDAPHGQVAVAKCR